MAPGFKRSTSSAAQVILKTWSLHLAECFLAPRSQVEHRLMARAAKVRSLGSVRTVRGSVTCTCSVGDTAPFRRRVWLRAAMGCFTGPPGELLQRRVTGRSLRSTWMVPDYGSSTILTL